jgi:hypothetical protein
MAVMAELGMHSGTFSGLLQSAQVQSPAPPENLVLFNFLRMAACEWITNNWDLISE